MLFPPIVINGIVGIIFSFFAMYFLKHRRYYKLAFSFSSIMPPIPSFLAAFIIIPFFKLNVYNTLRYIHKKGGDICGLWTLNFNVLLKTPDLVQEVLSSPHVTNKSEMYDCIRDIIGEAGLIVANDEWFKKSKKVFLRSFNASSSKIAVENFYIGTEELMRKLENEEGKWFFIQPSLRFATSSNIVRTAFGMEIEELDVVFKFLDNLDAQLLACSLRAFLPFINYESIHNPVYRILKGASEDVHYLGETVYNRKKIELLEMTEMNEETPNQYIYNLIRERDGDSMKDIYADIITLLLTALDTSAITTLFTLHLLAMHPEIQQRVFEEDLRIQTELGGKKMVDSDFARYAYLNSAIKEALRLFPTLPLFSRAVEQEIRVGKYTIPKNSSAIVYVPYLHRNPDIYPDPLKYDPDRFSPENSKNRHKCAFLPFGHGQRLCPGQRYGTQSVLFIISSIIRKYKVYTKYKSVEELDNNLNISVTLHEVKKYAIRLERR